MARPPKAMPMQRIELAQEAQLRGLELTPRQHQIHLRRRPLRHAPLCSIRRQQANDFGAIQQSARRFYNLLALAGGVPDGFRTRNLLSHSQALCH